MIYYFIINLNSTPLSSLWKDYHTCWLWLYVRSGTPLWHALCPTPSLTSALYCVGQTQTFESGIAHYSDWTRGLQPGNGVRILAGAGTSARWVPATISPRATRQGRGSVNSLLCSAQVKNRWSYTSSPPYVSIVWCLVKHRDNFYNSYVDTIGFWRWCITHRDTGFSDFVHRSDFS
jgi:hypothetical protein